MTVTVRPLAGAYDPPVGSLTVATPSCAGCCCCCCCCLTTVGVSAGVVAGAAAESARQRGRRRYVAVVLGLVPTVASIGVGWMVASAPDFNLPQALAAGAVAYPILSFLVLCLVGASLRRAALTAVTGIGVLALTLVIEIPVALATWFVVELAAPLVVMLGWKVGRWAMGGGQGGPSPAGSDQPSVPGPGSAS
jgi:membrane protein DedA with SNARE-associated domain